MTDPVDKAQDKATEPVRLTRWQLWGIRLGWIGGAYNLTLIAFKVWPF
jgi:hypothetical protein